MYSLKSFIGVCLFVVVSGYGPRDHHWDHRNAMDNRNHHHGPPRSTGPRHENRMGDFDLNEGTLPKNAGFSMIDKTGGDDNKGDKTEADFGLYEGTLSKDDAFTLVDQIAKDFAKGEKMELVFEWPQISFDFGSEEADVPQKGEETVPGDENSFFIPYNNVPVGLDRWKDKVFITIPRRAYGVPATVGYVSLTQDAGQKAPGLRPYPSLKANTFKSSSGLIPPLVSVYRPTVDRCNRLWLLDTGVVETTPTQKVQDPSIAVYDLNTDELISHYFIPTTMVKNGDSTGLVRITIDTEDGDCSNAYAYIADIFSPGLIIYSLKQNKAWRMIHQYFYIDPLRADFNVNGLQYQWRDGIFSIVLSTRIYNGKRTTYALFHPMATYKEFAVSTDLLKNETLATRRFHFDDLKILGERGELSQSACHDIHPGTGVVFLTLVARNAIGCWNTGKKLVPENVEILGQDDDLLFYSADLHVDKENNVWFLTNKFPAYFFSTLDTTKPNYRIFKMNVQKAIAGTKCAL